MKTHKWSDVKKHFFTTKQIAASDKWAHDECVRLRLRDLRRFSGKKQKEVAVIMKKTQIELSRTDHREDLLLSTIRAFVVALGGELEIRAVFGDKTVRIDGLISA